MDLISFQSHAITLKLGNRQMTGESITEWVAGQGRGGLGNKGAKTGPPALGHWAGARSRALALCAARKVVAPRVMSPRSGSLSSRG